MATRSLSSKIVFDPTMQRLCREYEDKALPDGGLAMCDEIEGIYLIGFRSPYISALIRDVLERWSLGGTMTELGDNIGCDHTAISRGLHWGDFSSPLEWYLMASPSRPKDWEKPIKKVFDARHRSGFIRVAEHLAKLLPDRQWHAPRVLSEFHAEVLFELIEQHDAWMASHQKRDFALAEQIVSSVCGDKKREILPFWLTAAHRKQALKLIKRMQSDTAFTFRYLCFLEARWKRVFVATKFATENMELERPSP